MESYVLTVSCPSRRGIVAAITGVLAGNICNITDSSQYEDTECRKFFIRLTFISEGDATIDSIKDSFDPIARHFGMSWDIYNSNRRLKVVLMVSKFGHCLNDLIYRCKIGALPIEIVAVISNHTDYEKLVIDNGFKFYHVKVSRDNKADAEAEILKILESSEAELVVLARYMQILSEDFCKRMSGRVINIHHSFLPSFKGALPYKQAFQRGVKLIGATAHYVTEDLDEGPIIEQDVARVTHAQSADDYVAIGRDVENQVLARAVHAHANNRVFLNSHRTIVFPASPGSYSN